MLGILVTINILLMVVNLVFGNWIIVLCSLVVMALMMIGE